MHAEQLEEVIAHARKHDLAHLEGRINALDVTLQQVANGSNLRDLSASIYLPGWTTLSEFALVLASVEEMIALANQLAGMQRALVKISGMIGTSGAAKPRPEGPPPAPPPREGGPGTVAVGRLLLLGGVQHRVGLRPPGRPDRGSLAC